MQTMQIKWEMSIGNITSMIVTIVTVGTLIWYLSNALTELRGTDQLFNLKIERLEADMKTARLDREMVIDMRADLRVLRQYMDDIIRKLTANAASNVNGVNPLTKDRP